MKPEKLYKIQTWLIKHRLIMIGKLIQWANRAINGVDIGLNTEIGDGFKIFHGVGIVVGGKVKIGKNCKLFQCVTIGRAHLSATGNRIAPILGDNVTIYTGALVMGPIHVGNRVTIGAHAIVSVDVPDNTKIPAGAIVMKPSDLTVTTKNEN